MNCKTLLLPCVTCQANIDVLGAIFTNTNTGWYVNFEFNGDMYKRDIENDGTNQIEMDVTGLNESYQYIFTIFDDAGSIFEWTHEGKTYDSFTFNRCYEI